MLREFRALGLVLLVACGGSGGETPDGGTGDASPDGDAAPTCPPGQAYCGGSCTDITENDSNCGGCGVTCTGAQHCAAQQCTDSNIQHVVLIVEENHTFDAYFGRYCTAASGSNPTCNAGPSCCERAPDTEPRGASPIVLDDNANFSVDRNHQQACEVQQIDNGKMDNYVSGTSLADTCDVIGFSVSSVPCSAGGNFALANATTVGSYWSLADNSALADRYFQPIAGSTSSNDMYLAISHYQFTDNAAMPDTYGCLLNCPGLDACYTAKKTTYTGRTTIADLLRAAGKTVTVYAEGFADAFSAGAGNCPGVWSNCPYTWLTHPVAYEACRFDASDIPFNYYSQFTDGKLMADYDTRFAADVAAGTLPTFSYLKAVTASNEHPNVSNITDGITFVEGAIQTIEQSSYASSTLILLTWDEGGGFFDHVAPPPSIDTDDSGNAVPYGTRVPMLAIGPFAKKGFVSHVQMEHSSIVRFLEYNFVGPVGQLGYNDAKVANIGSMLDPNKTGVHVPEN